MRKMLTIICIPVFVFALFFQTQQALANVYAAQLKITNPDTTEFDGNFEDGSAALILFYLNDDASSVSIDVIDASTNASIATIDGGAMTRGLNSVTWDGSGTVDNGQYVLRVTAEQPNASTTDWNLFYDSGDINIFTRGVATVTDQSDPNFGLTFTSNDGGPLGTGINIYNPDGSFHDPFLVAADVTSGGTVNYGTDAPIFAVLDEQGRIYVSLKDLGQIIRINRDYSTQLLIDGLTLPTGLYVEGDGADFTLYVSANNQVLRGNIGTADTFNPNNMEVVANFSSFFPRQIIRDDDGALYVTLRFGTGLGDDGRGIRKYDISGTLPVTDDDAVWFMGEDRTFIANDLLLDHGDDPNSSADDILYYCTRAGGGNNQDGIWRINDINSFFPDTVRIMTENTFYGGDENVNARSAIDFDAAGNIVFMENSNEHVFHLSPPGVGATNSFTTTAPDTFTVIPALGIGDDDLLPTAYRLKANYPNPFNPSTTIEYQLAKAGQTTLIVYNSLGQQVRTLVNGLRTAGQHSTTWDGRDDFGKEVSSGVYILRMQSGQFARSQRMTLLR